MGPFTTLVVDAAKWVTISLNKVYSRNLSTIEPSAMSSSIQKVLVIFKKGQSLRIAPLYNNF